MIPFSILSIFPRRTGMKESLNLLTLVALVALVAFVALRRPVDIDTPTIKYLQSPRSPYILGGKLRSGPDP